MVINVIKDETVMGRVGRIKEPGAIYHITSHSITEFDYFPDNSDKEYFLDILKQCAEKNHCKVYGYCLMSNHYHLIIDTCGYDISDFIKVLNQRHSCHIKRTYRRKGPLVDGRFHSKIIDTDQYLLTVSAYVHNNAKDIPGYSGREIEYPYSSMGIYVGRRKDHRNLVDTEFVLGIIDENDKTRAIKAYTEMVVEKKESGINIKLNKYLEEFRKEQFLYKPHRQVILRDKKPEELIQIIAKKFGINDTSQIMHRWTRATMEFRSVVAYSLNIFCGMNITDVCKFMYNITASCCAKLRDRGFEVLSKDKKMRLAILGTDFNL